MPDWLIAQVVVLVPVLALFLYGVRRLARDQRTRMANIERRSAEWHARFDAESARQQAEWEAREVAFEREYAERTAKLDQELAATN